MPDDLTISPVQPVAPPSREAVPTPSFQPAATQDATALPNPVLRLDSALGMVVIEFRNDSGAVTRTIPSQQQLDAYRTWERTGSFSGQAAPGAAVNKDETGTV